MEKYHNIKSFIVTATEYSRNPSETTASVLQRNLNAIKISADLTIFDPGSIILSEFYLSLYNLTKTLESKTSLTWCTLDVLQHVSKNLAARQTLIHTYKFYQVLARLLESNLITEKRIKVLKLLQELTYGIKIHWQEAHIPSLMNILTQWIMQSKEEEIITLSLGILINLCYKNISVIHTLMRTIDAKAFHRMLLKLQSSSVNTRVQCCKILMIMEQESQDIPEKFIFDFVDITFRSLVSALSEKNVLLIQHIVEFFDDIRQNEHTKNALVSCTNYTNYVKNILNQLDIMTDSECAALVIDFFISLMKLKLTEFISLYKYSLKIAIKWIPVDRVSNKALSLIKHILVDSRRTKHLPDLLSEIDLSIIMLALGSEDDVMEETREKRSLEKNLKISELLQLLQELIKIQNFRAQVVQIFTEQSMKKLLKPILENDINSELEWPGNLFQDSSVSMYIYALSFTADLAVQDSDWLRLYSSLIQNKQIQMIIALAVFWGDAEVKQKALLLMSSVGFPQECVSAVSKCMVELEPLVLVQTKTGITSGLTLKQETSFNTSIVRLYSLSQEEQLDDILDKLKEAFNENKFTDITTSAIMELYEYKLSAMRQTERLNQANLEAADNHAIGLQHRLTQIVAESSRLHQLLFHNQQSLEGLKHEKIRLTQKLQKAEIESKKIHQIQKKEIQGLKKIVEDKSKIIEQLSKLEKELNAAVDKIKFFEERNTDLEMQKMSLMNEGRENADKIKELNKLMTKLQDRLAKRDQEIQEKNREIESSQESMAALKQENEGLLRTCRNYEQTIAEKEDSVERMTSELVDLSRMRDMIYHLTAKKKDEKNETT
ncbi:hypothetical protein HCN44_007729 [Aphidius gifuensis]|uniref:CIP2A N-terminal domain-containing protein n=1 Tax=Aphidius gifuensis TaxID=684658 RepID=A0A834XPV3_APHGI|nr:uncharacterized protein LOC122857582 [Aphidius gifuensis]KAF7989199.1 hypothetical protein HCN44_007729 [Aphidius gifuensis]